MKRKTMLLARTLVGLLLFSVMNCGGGGGGDLTAPTVVSTMPAADAVAVETNAAVAASFSKTIDDSTLTASSFTVAHSGTNAAGTISYTDTTFTGTFTSVNSLALLTPYTATLTTAIADAAGNALAADYSWNFMTRDGVWGTAETIETDDAGDAASPQIAFDPSGNAISVWHQSDGVRNNIWSNRYTAGTGWGTAIKIETDDAGHAMAPQIAFDPSGNAISVWHQSDGTRNNIWSNRYTAGTGWGTAIKIETDDAGHAAAPQIAFDPSGNAIAVWFQSDGVRNNIWANRYTAGTGWGTAEAIETDDAGHAAAPQIAFDPSGNAIAVWYQSDGTRDNIRSNRYTAGTGWGTAIKIETDDAANATFPQIAIDSGDSAISVWVQSDGVLTNIWANRYTAETGWGTAEKIETNDAGFAEAPQIAFDPSGNAISVWQQSDGAWFHIWSNRYTAGTGWGTAMKIEIDEAADAQEPEIAIDSAGNAIVVWWLSDGTRTNIWANRYAAESGWGTAAKIETDDTADAESPKVAVDSGGNAISVWKQSDGTLFNILANRFE